MWSSERLPKAACNDFLLLHRLGTERLAVDSDSTLATRRPDGSLAVAVWYDAPPRESGPSEEMTLDLKGLEGANVPRVSQVDPAHGSALKAWEAMGRPDFHSPQQKEELRRAGELPPSEIISLPEPGPRRLKDRVASQGLAWIKVTKGAK